MVRTSSIARGRESDSWSRERMYIGRMAARSRRWIPRLLGAGAVVFVLLQAVRPALDNSPVTADLVAPAEVKEVLRASCYSCHSNETELPIYDRVVPAYWLVVHDVREGREHLNFSEIAKLPPGKQSAKLFEAFNLAWLGTMPPERYLTVHPSARMTPEKLAVLRAWVTTLATPPKADQKREEEVATGPVLPANGIDFPADYKDWRPISVSDRWDNGQVRQILGNDVAVKAIAAGTKTWPDGASFAKIGWAGKVDGDVWRAGEMSHVEFMFRDRKKFAKTEGWGFARWLGATLKPYEDRTHGQECISCHAPMTKREYVYSVPFARTDEVLGWRQLTTSADHAAKTLSVLYGDDAAIAHARAHAGAPYPPGARLALVTWKADEDPNWFGARIPASVASIERVTVTDTALDPRFATRPATLP